MSSKLLIDLNLNINYTVEFSCWVRIFLHKICRKLLTSYGIMCRQNANGRVFSQNKLQKENFCLLRISGHLILCRGHVDRDVAYYISFTSGHVVVFLMQVVPITEALFDAV
jgi:hypothetical protein